MNLKSYIKSISGKQLSQVKITILETLWSDNETFPKKWVPSFQLLKITNQKYFDRRIRELRDESGCDIEAKNINGEHNYRLVSSNISNANPRYYLSEKEKKALFTREANTCQVCGVISSAGVRGIQADHKIPLIRGGTHDETNWQVLCNECNVAKRRACQGCQLDCKTCTWAFPSTIGVKLTINLPPHVYDKVVQMQSKDSDWIVNEIIKLVEK